MRSVISYWALEGGLENRRSIEEAMAEAQASGFDGIELAIAEEGVLSVTSTRADCLAIRDAARRHGLCLETVASGISWVHCPTHPDPAVRERSIELQAQAL